MTIFRHKNGKLYTIEMVRRRGWIEKARPVATPYRHNVEIKNPKIEDFVPVSSK